MTMILYRRELALPTTTIALSRYEATWTPPLNGTVIFDHAFTINRPGLLVTSGHVHIRHKNISAPEIGTDYGIYANARIGIHSVADVNASDGALPPGGTIPLVLKLCGGNIADPVRHKYASPNLAFQKFLYAGRHRVEVYCSAGTDVYNVDGLGEIFEVDGILNQFNILVLAL